MKVLPGILITTVIWISTGPGTAPMSDFVHGPDVQIREGRQWLRVVSGICPQSRKTKKAPSRFYGKQNPLLPSSDNLERGKNLYQKEAKPTACRMCHGIRGNGNGRLAVRMEPPPRNFTCGEMMESFPDGQLFWIIKSGSRGTAMPAHKSTMSDREIWQLIHYIRQFTSQAGGHRFK